MTASQGNSQDSDLPGELSAPARRALTGAGYNRLEQLNGIPVAEIKKLHGMGPKGIEQLRRALAARGWAFAGEAQT